MYTCCIWSFVFCFVFTFCYTIAFFLRRYVVSNGAGPYEDGEFATILNYEGNVYCGDSMNIYAIEGYHDMTLNAELENMLFFSYMYCGLGYNYSCEITYYDDMYGCAEGESGLVIYENCGMLFYCLVFVLLFVYLCVFFF